MDPSNSGSYDYLTSFRQHSSLYSIGLHADGRSSNYSANLPPGSTDLYGYASTKGYGDASENPTPDNYVPYDAEELIEDYDTSSEEYEENEESEENDEDDSFEARFQEALRNKGNNANLLIDEDENEEEDIEALPSVLKGHLMTTFRVDPQPTTESAPFPTQTSEDNTDPWKEIVFTKDGLNPGRRGSLRFRGRGRRGPSFRPPEDSGDPEAFRPHGSGLRAKKRKRAPDEIRDEESIRLYGLAVAAREDDDHELAVEYASLAIQHDPRYFQAHALLADMYRVQGKEQDSVAAMIMGALSKKDEVLWHDCAERTLLLQDVDDKEVLEQAKFCYAQLLSITPEDIEARARKMRVHIELGQHHIARTECLKLLKRQPNDLEFLRDLADLSCHLDDIPNALVYYEDAIQLYTREKYTPDNPFSWSSLNVYLDLLDRSKQGEKGTQMLKKLGRWLLGREEETYWDYQPDDSEWDLLDEPRRVNNANFIPGKYPSESYGLGLPMELRIKLGMFRLKRKFVHLSEALYHFGHLNPEDDSYTSKAQSYDDLFGEVGDALREAKLSSEALYYYEPIRQIRPPTDIAYYLALADCYKDLDRITESEACIKHVLNLDPNNAEARLKLAVIFEGRGMLGEAYDLIREIEILGRRDLLRKSKLSMKKLNAAAEESGRGPGKIRVTTSSNPNSARRRKKPTNGDDTGIRARSKIIRRIAQQDAERIEKAHLNEVAMRAAHERLKELEPAVDGQDQAAMTEYLEKASFLMKDFRGVRAFFPETEQWMREGLDLPPEKSQIKKRKVGSTDMPSSYRKISFDDWLDLHCRAALLHARFDQPLRVWRIFDVISFANVFWQYDERVYRSHVAAFACALLLNDEERICAEARWFIRAHPYASDVFRNFSLSNKVFVGRPNWYNSGPTQKFILRQVKAMDYALLTPEQRDLYQWSTVELSSYTGAGQGDGNPHRLEELDPAVLVAYAHVLLSGGNHMNSLNYYFRAYTMVPEDAVVNLCIASAYIQHGMKRHSENRQYQLQQGIAFLQKYYDIRSREAGEKGAVLLQEAEFNMARTWHLLGLGELAIQAYERVFELSGKVQEEGRVKVEEKRKLRREERKREREEARERREEEEERRLREREESQSGERMEVEGEAHNRNGDTEATGEERDNEPPEDRVWQSEEDNDEDDPIEDFAPDAAFALQILYGVSGAYGKAREVTERWLVI
ncbi:TPR-like protein [Patellaria atrata CBS 101060]|uniref:TPR-like protein n=1 Tax=Patellaria atrata CBS 101060 TaxID=1346257 RepID=A0A9P4S4A9_9PEZI|nr:TPR-like protein [Patellaria atrata CBS 101060]